MEKKKQYLTRKAKNKFIGLALIGIILYAIIGGFCVYCARDNGLITLVGIAILAFALIQLVALFSSKQISKTKFIILMITSVVPLILLVIIGDGWICEDFDGDDFCTVCPNCGSEITSKQNYCSHCGKSKEQK